MYIRKSFVSDEEESFPTPSFPTYRAYFSCTSRHDSPVIRSRFFFSSRSLLSPLSLPIFLFFRTHSLSSTTRTSGDLRAKETWNEMQRACDVPRDIAETRLRNGKKRIERKKRKEKSAEPSRADRDRKTRAIRVSARKVTATNATYRRACEQRRSIRRSRSQARRLDGDKNGNEEETVHFIRGDRKQTTRGNEIIGGNLGRTLAGTGSIISANVVQ